MLLQGPAACVFTSPSRGLWAPQHHWPFLSCKRIAGPEVLGCPWLNNCRKQLFREWTNSACCCLVSISLVLMCEIDLRLISWFQKNSRFFFPLDQRFLRRRKRNKRLKKQKQALSAASLLPRLVESEETLGRYNPIPSRSWGIGACWQWRQDAYPSRARLPRKQGLGPVGGWRFLQQDAAPSVCSVLSRCLGPPEVREMPSPLVWGTGWLAEHLPIEVLGVRAGAQQCFQNLLLNKSHPCFPNHRVSALSLACLFST